MKYYKKINSRSIYRTQSITFNTGEVGLQIERYNEDFNNWTGHIHNREKTRAQLLKGVEIIEITRKEAMQRVKNTFDASEAEFNYLFKT